MYKDIKEIIQSKRFRFMLIGLGFVVSALLIFQAGMFVGYRKAAFSYKFGDNYYRVFSDHKGRSFRSSLRGSFIDGYGAVGKIISVNLPTFVVAGTDEVERIVLITDDTRIRRFDKSITPSELKTGDFVVVFGSPNESSQVEAKLIRFIPLAANIGATSSAKSAKQ